MSRYIDADILAEFVKEEFDGLVVYDVPPDEAVDDICDIIDSCPTADVAPVVHGRWIEVYENNLSCECLYCSMCGYREFEERTYCAHCGAKMDESEDEE